MRVDLHMHTTHSDGELLPKQVVEQAKSNKVSIMAITDHDEISGYEEALPTARDFGISLIPALEFNTDGEQGELHILGYGVDPGYRKLRDYISWRKNERVQWSKRILTRLRELGYNIEWQACFERANQNVIVRTHIADELVSNEYFSSSEKAFQALLTKGAPAFIKREGLSAYEAIKLIQAAGGKAFLAHPGLYYWDWSLQDLVESGLDGIEVYYSKHSQKETAYWNEQADYYSLLKSVGSDFHGPASRNPFPIGSVHYEKEHLMNWVEELLHRRVLR